MVIDIACNTFFPIEILLAFEVLMENNREDDLEMISRPKVDHSLHSH